jgi:hypothetical protein
VGIVALARRSTGWNGTRNPCEIRGTWRYVERAERLRKLLACAGTDEGTMSSSCASIQAMASCATVIPFAAASSRRLFGECKVLFEVRALEARAPAAKVWLALARLAPICSGRPSARKRRGYAQQHSGSR